MTFWHCCIGEDIFIERLARKLEYFGTPQRFVNITIAAQIAYCRNHRMRAVEIAKLHTFKGRDIVDENGADLIKSWAVSGEVFLDNPLRKGLGGNGLSILSSRILRDFFL